MIDAKNILQTDLLDLLFDGRNKLYGAYELRAKYNKRMMVAVTIMIACCLLLFFFFAFASGKYHSSKLILGPDISLSKVEPDIKQPEVLPPPPKQKLPQINTIRLTTPIITSEEVKPEEQPPNMEDVEKAKIGTITQAGEDYADVVAPPISGENTGVIERPKKPDTEDDGIIIHVEIESEYPGGIEAWRRFLGKTIRYPEDAIEKEIQGTVLVQFIVDKAGIVSDVEAISGPNELRDEAVRVIKKSGQWKPAIQNGRQVKSYKRQPIIFVLQ